MPFSSPKPCTYPGCGRLVRGGSRCAKHLHESRQAQHRHYDRSRESSSKRGYDGTWRKIRLQHLREEPLCMHCKAKGIIKAGEHVDHVIPLKVGGTHAKENRQTLCQPCHNAKTHADRRRYPQLQ